MDRTIIEHLVVALVLQAIIGFSLGDWWLGAAFGAAVFIGREHSHAEYRYINANGGKRYKTPLPAEIGCFHPKYWDLGSLLDWLVPVIGVVLLALAAEKYL